MNGAESLCLPKEFLMPSPRAKLDRRKAAGPIVEMHNVGRLAHPVHERDRGSTEKREALEIIVVTIDLAAREIIRRIDQIRGPIQSIALKDANAGLFSAPLKFQIFKDDSSDE